MRLKLVFVALAALGSASCGRTHQGGASEGNGPGPCTLDCQRVCQLAASCGAMPEGACLNACQLSSAQPPQIACLQQLICGGSQRCDAVNQCVVNPTVPDLVVSSFNATSPGTGQLSYVATVCNRGTGLATGISVDFYRNRQSRPGAADRGEVTTSIRALDPGQCESVSGSESGLASGTYRSYVQVDAARRIVEINEGNNVGGPDTTTVQGNVGTQPDLTVRLTVTVGSQVGTGRSVRYSARICNNGAQTAGASRVDIYYDRASRPSTSSAGNRSIYVSSLPAGACRTSSVSATRPVGSYRAWAQIDRLRQVSESNESNNVDGPHGYTVSPGGNGDADLRVTGLVGGEQIGGYRVTVCNTGRAAASNVRVGIYYNRSSAPPVGSTPSRSVYLGTVNANDCVVRQVSVQLPAGTYRSWAFVDYQNVVAELSEVNNVLGPVTFTITGTLPDLTVNMSASTSLGGPVVYSLTACNLGGPLSSSVRVGVYYNRTTPPPLGISPSRVVTTTIPTGGCVNRSLSAQLQPGTYRSWAQIDYLGSVTESNESNNRSGPHTVTVVGGQVNLRVVGLLGYQQGASTVYRVTVCNFGTTNALQQRVGIYYDRTTAPVVGTPTDREIIISSLGAGACTTRSTNATLMAGTHQSWALADARGQIAESDESDNAFGPVAVQVGGGGAPDLTLSSLTATPAPNGLVYYSALCCNQGQGLASNVRVYLYYNLPVAPVVGQAGYQRTQYLGTLTAGACQPVTIVGQPPAGNLLSWLFVDQPNVVSETDENNNTAAVKVSVGGGLDADLVVDTYNTSLNMTGTVSFVARVCNRGLAQSSSVPLALYDNLPAAPTINTPPSRILSVPPLTPQACTTLSAQATLPAGTYSSWAFVDPPNIVTELDETNNIAGPSTFVVGSTTQQCPVICKTLISPCNMLPATEQQACEAFCNQRSQAQKDCAYKAAVNLICSQIPTCLFNP